MKRTLMIVLAALTLSLSGLAWAEQPADPNQSTPASGTTAQQEPAATSKIDKMEFSGPPEELKKLTMFIGSWNAQQHMFESARGPESNSAGKSGYKWSFDGMHLEGTHTLVMGGKSMNGRSVWGWDPDRKQYQIVWIDNLSPVSYVYYGTFAQDNMMVLFTTSMMQGKAITEKMTFNFKDADSFSMFMENDMSGDMKKVMEETVTRVKPAAKPKPKSTGTAAKKPATSTTTKK